MGALVVVCLLLVLHPALPGPTTKASIELSVVNRRQLQQSPPPSPGGDDSLGQAAQTAGGNTYNAVTDTVAALCGGQLDIGAATARLAGQVAEATGQAYARGSVSLPNSGCSAVRTTSGQLADAVAQALSSSFSSVSNACQQ
ncbi:hypothetical protein V8C86DRAFT_2438579, partial [Haematococcus lacustris]